MSAPCAPRMRRAAAGALLLLPLLPLYTSACEFNSSGWSLAFGTLAPGSDVNVTAQVAGAGAGACPPVVQMRIRIISSEHGNGTQLRLKQTGGTAFIPYTLTFPTQLSGARRRVYVPIRPFQGEIQGAAYRDAPPGDYSDRVVLQVTP